MRKIEKEYWNNVRKTKKDECWEWQGEIHKSGRARYKKLAAPKYLYEKINDQIPIGQFLSHTCNNKICCNPRHLYISTPEKRFWGKVDKKNKCWEWQGHLSKGYGSFRYKGKVRRAHKVILDMVGKLPIGSELCVCHICNNPKCVNPEHLWVGTVQENNQDMFNKGRQNGQFKKGDKNPNAKLTKIQVIEIKRRLKEGDKKSELAEEFDVKWINIWRIATGRRWGNV